jgi:hypothetical protein
MGIFRYIVQGAGWELGRQAAREGIEALEDHVDEQQAPDPREVARREREQRARDAAEDERRRRAAAQREADIEAQLRALKQRAGKK